MGRERLSLLAPFLLQMTLTTGGLTIVDALEPALTCQDATAAAKRNPTALRGDYRETAGLVENNILARWSIDEANFVTVIGSDSN